MKRMLWLVGFMSATAFADSGTVAAKLWIQNTLANKAETTLLGQTPQGERCGLTLGDNQNGVYTLIVSSLQPLGAAEVVTTDRTQIVYDPSLMFFTNINTVAIQVDDNGSVARAVGSNGSMTIDCKFK